MVASSSWRRGALSVDMSFPGAAAAWDAGQSKAVTVQRRRMSGLHGSSARSSPPGSGPAHSCPGVAERRPQEHMASLMAGWSVLGCRPG